MSFIKALALQNLKGSTFETFPLFFHYKLIKNLSPTTLFFFIICIAQIPSHIQRIYACHPTVSLIFILILILNISEMNHCQGHI